MFSLVIPFHRDYGRLEKTISTIALHREKWKINEILLCHNGQELDPTVWRHLEALLNPPFSRLLHTDSPGLGAGYRLGIGEATEPYTVLSASDLPFEFSDVAAFLEATPRPALAVGSKLHPRSVTTGYGWTRRLGSIVFFVLRRILLGQRMPRDSQGTIIIQSSLAKRLVSAMESNDYLFSLELIVRASVEGVDIVEVPVNYTPNSDDDRSSVSLLRDGWKMVLRTIRLMPLVRR